MITIISKGRAKAGRMLGPAPIVPLDLGIPIAADDDRIVVTADFVLNGAQVIAAQPDVPRNLTIYMVDANASITAGKITIVGEDMYGRAISDVWDIPTNLAGSKVTKNIYAKVTSVTTSGITGAIGAGADQVKVGVGAVIGTPDMAITTAVKHVYLGGVRVASPTLASGMSQSGVDVSASTYDGTKHLMVYMSLGQ